MKRWHSIALGILALIVIVGAVVYVRLHPGTVDAQVTYKSGTVLVNGQSIQADQILKEGDVVTTQTGRAVVTVYEAAVITLGEDTSVTLTDLNSKHSKVDQTAGSSVVAFVPGTKLKQLDITQDGITREVTGTFLSVSGASTFVRYGIVTVKFGNTVFHLEQGYVQIINVQTGEVTNRVLTSAEEILLNADIRDARDSLIEQRLTEIEKNSDVVKVAESLSGLSKEELLARLTEYDTKTAADVLAIRDAIPVVTSSMDKIGSYTIEIQNLNYYLAKQ